MRLPVQCRMCFAMSILEPTEAVMDECDSCEAVHVSVAAVGTCRRCGTALDQVAVFMVAPDALLSHS